MAVFGRVSAAAYTYDIGGLSYYLIRPCQAVRDRRGIAESLIGFAATAVRR